MSLLEQYMADYQRVCAEKVELQAHVAELTEIGRRMSEQVDELTEGRIQRNARIAELEEALREIAEADPVLDGLAVRDAALAALAHKEET